MRHPFYLIVLGLSLVMVPLMAVSAQAADPAPVTFTTEQDHQNMMEQLKIKTLRPGPSGDPAAPNSANYDEAKANPYPVWPDILTSRAGKKVTTADQWWTQRRPEIVEDFAREVYGRVPAQAPKVTWKVAASEVEYVGFKRVTATQLVGQVDNQAFPAIDVKIEMMLVLPMDVKGTVPVLIMFGPANFPSPRQPSPEELARINQALKAEAVARDPSLKEVFDRLPAYDLVKATPFPPPPGQGPEARLAELINAGWGVAVLNPASIQADNGAGLTRGIIGLTNKGQPRKPEDWGALRAWAWGASRAFDHLATLPQVDAKHIGIEGVSRYGKAALVTMAFDQRFALVLVGSSGEGGAKPHRRHFGEAVENLTGSGQYHWMAGNFLKYGGPKNAGDLPVDAHQLIALCAPRLTFISYGIPENGDAKWLDQKGSYMATVAAGVAWKLLGAKDLGVGNDYAFAQMPPVNTDQLDGQLAWRQHDGGHTDAPNIKHFIKWADRNIGQ